MQHMPELIRDLSSYWKAAHDELQGATIERGPMPVVLCNERQFTQVLVEFLSNALKYRLMDLGR